MRRMRQTEFENRLNTNKFVKRMNTSMKYKIEMLDHIKEDAEHIIDYGCGSGLLGIAAAERFPNAKVVLYDKNLEMLNIAQDNIDKSGLSNVSVCSVFMGQPDHILVSSVMHEVGDHVAFLTTLSQRLRKGGAIILREGYKHNISLITGFEIRDLDDFDQFQRAVNLYPDSILYRWMNGTLFQYEDRYIHGNIHTVASILNKYTWGTESLSREAYESYLQFNNVELERIVSEADKGSYFHPLFIEKYILTSQDDYFNHLDKKVVLNGSRWATHMIAVIRKGALV